MAGLLSKERLESGSSIAFGVGSGTSIVLDRNDTLTYTYRIPLR